MATEQRIRPTELRHATPELATMQAIVQDEYDEAEDVLRLEEIDRPETATTRCCFGSRQPAWIGASGSS